MNKAALGLPLSMQWLYEALSILQLYQVSAGRYAAPSNQGPDIRHRSRAGVVVYL